MQSEKLLNRGHEAYQLAADVDGHYAYSLDVPFHVTRHFQFLSEAIMAAEREEWLPLDNLAESLR